MAKKIVCDECRAEFWVARRFTTFFGIDDSPEFCSAACMCSYVRRKRPYALPDDRIALWDRRVNADVHEFYSPSLGMHFCSGFERTVAEIITFVWKMNVLYEPHAVIVGEDEAYVPDFYFPDHDIWLEVKGGWMSGAKRKFSTACGIMPGRFVLLSGFYWKEICVLGRRHSDAA